MKNALVINSLSPIPPKSVGTWNNFDGNTTNFIKQIQSAAVANGDGDGNTKGIVSGIPTPWARATVFKQALDNTVVSPGLQSFYDKIVTEWRALLAHIALNGSGLDIRIKKIKLDGGGFKSKLATMLFGDVDKWKDPNNLNGAPYVQLIQHKVDAQTFVTIGATSPYSIIFTPPQINNNGNPIGKFIDVNGHWKDPLTCNLTFPELQTIYDNVTYIRNHINGFANAIGLNPTSLDNQLDRYQQALLGYNNGGVSGANIQKFNILDRAPIFKTSPFDKLFNASTQLFQQLGRFYLNGVDDGLVGFKVNEFFAESEKAVEIVFNSNDGEEPKKNTGHFLTVNYNGNKRYFAIPLSEKGILFFQDKLEDLLIGNGEHSLKGEVVTTPIGTRLKVYLDITYYDSPNNSLAGTTRVEKLYEISAGTNLKDRRVIVWPNFVSSNWNKYYLYNELPHNLDNNHVRVTPLLGVINGGILEIAKNGNNQINYVEPSLADENTNLNDVKLAVKANINNPLEYEIYESARPFVGVELRVGTADSKKAGYIIAKDVNAIADGNLNLSFIDGAGAGLANSIVGIDFGSNNTCFSHYSINNQRQELIKLTNRRRFFIGSDRNDNPNRVANGSELFFFNKTESDGHLKSMVLSHNSNMIFNFPGNIQNVVRGGFAVSEKNLPISPDRMPNPDTRYELAINGIRTEAIHNMKWSPDPKMNDYKKSYLKSLWLQIHAELFEIGHKPTTLRWAYPSAMNAVMITNYENLWNNVISVSPLNDGGVVPNLDVRTEGEAVATYAKQLVAGAPGGGLNVGANTLGIGYDVGGSTTDILLLINQDGNTVLAKQSSVLLAAQYISRAIKKSEEFRNTLQQYLTNNGIGIYRIGQMNEGNSPYFLNAVFDRLTAKQLDQMYLHFYNNNQRKILALAAYISGLLVYYTGQLAARVIKVQDANIDNITKGIYGKGGNIFNWVSTPIATGSEDFYEKCFNAGLGQNDVDEQIAALQNDSGNIEQLEERLASLRATYEIVPSEEVRGEIRILEKQIAQIESNDVQVDVKQLQIEIDTITIKINTIKDNQHIPAVRESLEQLQSELEQKQRIVNSVQDLNNDRQIAFLQRIRNVNIAPTTSYKTKPAENKTEVSYGLSLQNPISIAAIEIPDIIGEAGYAFNGQELDFTDEVTVDQFNAFGGDFRLPTRFQKLEEFVDIYCNFVSTYELLSANEVALIREQTKRLPIDYFQAYVTSMPQFEGAFKSPLIILEGMCLLDNIIIEQIL